MRVLPSGSTAILVELDDLDGVLGLYAALSAAPVPGVVDVVPAARTVLLVADLAKTTLSAVEEHVRAVQHRQAERPKGALVEVPVTYDGEDLPDVAAVLDCGVDEVMRRHTSEEWTVAFAGFSPGFAYIAPAGGGWHVPRRTTPRTRMPAGAVTVANGFTGIYPRETPGGWQIIGHTDVQVFDVERDPPALLTPGARVRFIDTGCRRR